MTRGRKITQKKTEGETAQTSDQEEKESNSSGEKGLKEIYGQTEMRVTVCGERPEGIVKKLPQCHSKCEKGIL